MHAALVVELLTEITRDKQATRPGSLHYDKAPEQTAALE